MIDYQCPACAGHLQATEYDVGQLGQCPTCGHRTIVPDLRKVVEFPPDFDASLVEICRQVLPYTMTSIERIFALCQSVEYVVAQQVPGDIVECGVWKGGSMMAAALTLMRQAAVRTLHLFDTFDGMPAASPIDKDYHGQSAADYLRLEDKVTSRVWAYSPLAEVQANMRSTGYDERHVLYTPGKVEETLPAHAPQQIAVLRLDTDWHDSTYHELVHLYPRLSVGGVLIIDDYGHWAGARRAVDQYIREHRLKLLLQRIDYTARLAVKLQP